MKDNADDGLARQVESFAAIILRTSSVRRFSPGISSTWRTTRSSLTASAALRRRASTSGGS